MIVWMICAAMFNCVSAVKNPKTTIAHQVDGSEERTLN